MKKEINIESKFSRFLDSLIKEEETASPEATQQASPTEAPSTPEPVPKDTEAEAETEKQLNPNDYTEKKLKELIDPTKGVSPEMFENYINMFSMNLEKLIQKKDFIKSYHKLYDRIKLIIDIKEELGQGFETFMTTLKDTISNKSELPEQGTMKTDTMKGPGVK